jgi:DnaJ like chaperone protein
MQYHPDKVSHLGEEFKKIAEEKMKEINIAYMALSRK